MRTIPSVNNSGLGELKMLYVIDTHAFVWYMNGTLPPVDDTFKSAEKGESTLFIPTIVLAEDYCKKSKEIKFEMH